MECYNCGAKMSVIKDRPYKYKECGLEDVTIIGVTIHVCENCGEEYVSIPRVKGLHNVIGELICKKEGRLSGSEVRFLRKDMRMTGVEFARMLGVTPEHVSRVESDAKAVSPTLGRLMRAMYMICICEGSTVNSGTFHDIAQPHEEINAPFNIQLNPSDWLVRDNKLCACC